MIEKHFVTVTRLEERRLIIKTTSCRRSCKPRSLMPIDEIPGGIMLLDRILKSFLNLISHRRIHEVYGRVHRSRHRGSQLFAKLTAAPRGTYVKKKKFPYRSQSRKIPRDIGIISKKFALSVRPPNYARNSTYQLSEYLRNREKNSLF